MNSSVHQWDKVHFITLRRRRSLGPSIFSCPLSLSENIKGLSAEKFCERFEMIIKELFCDERGTKKAKVPLVQ